MNKIDKFKNITRNSILAALLVSTSAVVGAAEVSTNGKLRITSDDEKFQYIIGGRADINAAYYDEDVKELDNGAEIRRMRLFIKGYMYKDWNFRIRTDFAGDEVELYDAYLGYSGFENTNVRVGKIGGVGSIEDNTSSKYTTFIERAAPAKVWGPGRNIGIQYSRYWDTVNFSAGAYFTGDESDDHEEDGVDENLLSNARFIYSPWHEDGSVLHLGIWGEYSALKDTFEDGKSNLRLRSRPEAHVDGTRFIDTKDIENADSYQITGIEYAQLLGPIHLQAEYITQSIDRKGDSSLEFDGWYAQASYFITGESPRYVWKKADFSRVKPNSDGGAWEVAIRHSSVDLIDGDFSGGKMDLTTLGVNYYVNKNIKFMINYTQVDSTSRKGVDDDPNILQGRIAFYF